MNKELIVLCGPPGSGKSTLRFDLLETDLSANGITFVNQDEMGKKEHFNIFTDDLQDGSNIIVDRMSFNKEQRAKYIEPARKLGYKVKIIVLHESYDTCLKRCIERKDHETIKDEETARKALHTFFSKYERPTEDEADEIEFRYPDTMKPNACIIDLDGTLCNIDHRLHFLDRHPVLISNGENEPKEVYTKPDWKNFFANMTYDTPNKWCKDIVALCAQRYDIILCSGRPDDYKKVTQEWLHTNDIKYDALFMRSRNDFRKDFIIKEQILDFEILTRYNPVFAIDDRSSVVQMWRDRGITTLACADGDF